MAKLFNIVFLLAAAASVDARPGYEFGARHGRTGCLRGQKCTPTIWMPTTVAPEPTPVVSILEGAIGISSVAQFEELLRQMVALRKRLRKVHLRHNNRK